MPCPANGEWLTRSLRQWIGITPTQIASTQMQLSFLYKTESFSLR